MPVRDVQSVLPASRRVLLRAIGLGAAACLAPRPGLSSDAPLALTVQIGWIANVEYATQWIGIEKGLFARRGLSVKVSPGGPDAPDPLVMVAAGDAQIGFASWLPFLDAVARGNDYVLVAAQFQSSPLGVISLKGHPLLSAHDLLGQRILAQGANEKTSIEATLAMAGLPRDEWTMVPAGFSPEPLLSGVAAGYTGFATNQVLTLEGMGLKRDHDFFFRSFDQLGLRSYAGLVFCSSSFLRANRPVVVGYIAALIEAERLNEQDPAYAAHLAVDTYGADYGLDLAQQTRQNEVQIPYIHPGLKPGFPVYAMDRDAMQSHMYAAARAAGRSTLPPIDRIADFSVARDAQTARG